MILRCHLVIRGGFLYTECKEAGCALRGKGYCMRIPKSVLSGILVLLLVLAFVSPSRAETDRPAFDPQSKPDYVLRIDGGKVSEHLETVSGREALRVDLYLDGVTNEKLLSSISFKLAYDPDQLTYVKYKPFSGNSVMNTINPNEPGLIQYAFASANGSAVSGDKPFLTFWFTVAEGLADGTQIRFSVTEAIKADSVAAGSYHSQKRTVGTDFLPFTVGDTFFGDANCDGAVTAADAAFVLRALTGLETIPEQGLRNAKVDGTDALNSEDAALILRYAVKLIDRFPVQE